MQSLCAHSSPCTETQSITGIFKLCIMLSRVSKNIWTSLSQPKMSTKVAFVAVLVFSSSTSHRCHWLKRLQNMFITHLVKRVCLCLNCSHFLVSALGSHWSDHCIVWFVLWVQGVASLPFITRAGINSPFGLNCEDTIYGCRGTKLLPWCKYNSTVQIVPDEIIE